MKVLILPAAAKEFSKRIYELYRTSTHRLEKAKLGDMLIENTVKLGVALTEIPTALPERQVKCAEDAAEYLHTCVFIIESMVAQGNYQSKKAAPALTLAAEIETALIPYTNTSGVVTDFSWAEQPVEEALPVADDDPMGFDDVYTGEE